jgi:hypothetical protein
MAILSRRWENPPLPATQLNGDKASTTCTGHRTPAPCAGSAFDSPCVANQNTCTLPAASVRTPHSYPPNQTAASPARRESTLGCTVWNVADVHGQTREGAGPATAKLQAGNTTTPSRPYTCPAASKRRGNSLQRPASCPPLRMLLVECWDAGIVIHIHRL